MLDDWGRERGAEEDVEECAVQGSAGTLMERERGATTGARWMMEELRIVRDTLVLVAISVIDLLSCVGI